MQIAVINYSTRVSEADLGIAVQAVQHQLRYDVSPAWGARAVSVSHHHAQDLLPAGSYVLGVYDDADQADALGYHTEDPDGTIYGKVFAGPVLDNGGTVLDGELSVSAVLSHEVLETFVDPHVQLWASDGASALYAYEVCDAVEEQSYSVQVAGHPLPVSVSNFVFPEYFDAQAPAGTRLDFLDNLTVPLSLSKGGYAVKMTLGKGSKVSQVFGEEFADWKRPSKTHALARLTRRLGGVLAA